MGTLKTAYAAMISKLENHSQIIKCNISYLIASMLDPSIAWHIEVQDHRTLERNQSGFLVPTNRSRDPSKTFGSDQFHWSKKFF